MDFGRFKVVTFDCYGTLIDWEAGLHSALAKWSAKHGGPTDRRFLLEVFADIEHGVQKDNPRAPYRDILRIVHERLGDRLKLPSVEADQIRFCESVGDWPAFPDSTAALRVLARHFQLVIVSNIDLVSFERSRRRLDVEFDAVVTAEEVGAYKPDLRMFQAAFTRVADWGVEPEQILHVAQSLFHDHGPAKELGLKTVWVDRRASEPGAGATPEFAGQVTPDLTVSNLADLATMVGEAFGE